MAPSSPFFFFLMLCCTPKGFLRPYAAAVTSTASHSRRTLHQPFFPKYPSSTYSSPSSHPTFGPFFPLYPSPPHPPPASSAATFPTFPVNVSSMADASSSSPSRRSPSSLLPAVATPLLAVAFLVLSFVLFLHLRRRQGGGADNDVGSDSIRFFPPRAASSSEQEIATAAAPSSAATLGGSEFLFVGAAGSSQRDTSESCASGGFATYWKLRSPELRPLPPLPRQVLIDEVCRSSSTSDEEICSANTSPPPPPKPTSLLRPPTPSPPKRRPPAHSPPSSPMEAESDEKVRTLQNSPRKNLRSPRKIGDFARSALIGEQNPPPPAPVLAAGSHEGQNVNIPTFRLPLLAPPRDSVLKKTVISRETPNAAEMQEENLGPNSKRPHSDKSQASPEHAMVLDHLKSGSLQ